MVTGFMSDFYLRKNELHIIQDFIFSLEILTLGIILGLFTFPMLKKKFSG